MIKKIIAVILSIIIVIIFVSLSINLTGNIILGEDKFSNSNKSHWTHMPVTYSIGKECGNEAENIKNAMGKIISSTNNSVYFREAENTEEYKNPDIKFSCSYLENCYQNKTERRWFFWVVTTEAICEHESGTAQITKIRGKKILKARINLIETGKKDNCSETIIHEILHAFDFPHSEDKESIMFPEKENSGCSEKIDKEIISGLIETYKG